MYYATKNNEGLIKDNKLFKQNKADKKLNKWFKEYNDIKEQIIEKNLILIIKNS